MDLIIRRIERIHEVEHGIQDGDRTDLRQYFVFTCVCQRGNDAAYFAQKHKIGGQKLEMKYTESDRVLQEWTSKRCKSAMP